MDRKNAVLVVALAVFGAAAACGPLGGGSPVDALGLRHAYWRASDRVLVTDFGYVGAVTTGQRFAFAGSENGVVVYDHRFGRWESPLTIEDGFPRADLPVELEVDPFAGTLWMVTRTGALWSYDVPGNADWRWVGVLPGAPPVELTAWDGSLWARTGSGWFESGPGGSTPVRAQPPAEVQQRSVNGLALLERESAAFRSVESTLTIDEWLRRFDVTSAAESPELSEWYLGTWGGGLYRYDDRMLDAQPMRFGTVGRGVSAIAETPGAGGWWFGGDGLGRRHGLAHADPALQSWSWFESDRQGAPGGQVHAIVDTGAGVFVGAQDGLFRLAGDRWERLTDMDALPATAVRSLAWAAGALWVGTERGLALVTAHDDRMSVERIDGTLARIDAIVARDSLLWLATDRGLIRIDLASGAVAQPPLDDARLRGRILGLALDGPTLYALTPSALLVYDGARWSAPPPPASLAAVGRPLHVAARAGIVWITGSAGALGFDPATGAETLLSVPRDIPEGPVRQALPVDGGVWFATPAGALLVRFE